MVRSPSMNPAFAPARAAAIALALACACSRDEAAGPPRAEALLGGSAIADTPWPCDTFLKNGRLEVGPIPLEGKPGPLAALTTALGEVDGAPTYTSVFFPVTVP